jgi:hypothetical protein
MGFPPETSRRFSTSSNHSSGGKPIALAIARSFSKPGFSILPAPPAPIRAACEHAVWLLSTSLG